MYICHMYVSSNNTHYLKIALTTFTESQSWEIEIIESEAKDSGHLNYSQSLLGKNEGLKIELKRGPERAARLQRKCSR